VLQQTLNRSDLTFLTSCGETVNFFDKTVIFGCFFRKRSLHPTRPFHKVPIVVVEARDRMESTMFSIVPPHRTSPLQVDDWELEADFEKIEQQWKPLGMVLDSEPWFVARIPEISGWSSGEQAGHAVLVLQLIATRVLRVLGEPELAAEILERETS